MCCLAALGQAAEELAAAPSAEWAVGPSEDEVVVKPPIPRRQVQRENRRQRRSLRRLPLYINSYNKAVDLEQLRKRPGVGTVLEGREGGSLRCAVRTSRSDEFSNAGRMTRQWWG